MNLSAPTTNTVTMIYGTGDGTATSANATYTPTWGTLTFYPGQTSQTVAVPVAGLTGTGFIRELLVDFGAVAASSFTVDSPTQITATSPAGTGTVNVTVVTPAGISAVSSADQFTYVAPVVPAISVGDVTVNVGVRPRRPRSP